MADAKYPVTPAIRALRAAGIVYEPHLYDYEEHGGTRRAAAELGVEEHAVIKTLVMQTDPKNPLLVLMHGDREVAVGMLAKAIGAKSVTPCDPATAQKHTGYLVGGTSPFGTKTPNLPVYVERTIFDLPRCFINGGKRGFLVALAPDALRQTLPLREVEVAAPVAG
jgi:Cys-tRNA(Pro) deacylase